MLLFFQPLSSRQLSHSLCFEQPDQRHPWLSAHFGKRHSLHPLPPALFEDLYERRPWLSAPFKESCEHYQPPAALFKPLRSVLSLKQIRAIPLTLCVCQADVSLTNLLLRWLKSCTVRCFISGLLGF
jgi:hypothetical protein